MDLSGSPSSVSRPTLMGLDTSCQVALSQVDYGVGQQEFGFVTIQIDSWSDRLSLWSTICCVFRRKTTFVELQRVTSSSYRQ